MVYGDVERMAISYHLCWQIDHAESVMKRRGLTTLNVMAEGRKGSEVYEEACLRAERTSLCGRPEETLIFSHLHFSLIADT